MRIGIIGVGHLAATIVARLMSTGWSSEGLVLAPRGKSAELAVEHGLHIAADNADLVSACDVVLLCVRPADAPAAVAGLPWREGQTLVSACAGVTLRDLQHASGLARVVRIMPLTAMLLGASPTTVYPNAPELRPMLERLGSVLPLRSEAELEVATTTAAVYGWVQDLVLATTDWLVEHGLEPATARQLTARTFTAAGRLTAESPEALEDLMRSIVTPGGITELGLTTLAANGAPEAWLKACEAVRARLAGARSR